MLKSDEVALLQAAATNFREFSTRGFGTYGPEMIDAHAVRIGMSQIWIGLGAGRAVGFTDEGHAAIAKLARSQRKARTAGMRRASAIIVQKAVATIVCGLLAGQPPGRLSAEGVAAADTQITEWFDAHDVLRTHYVPCRITPSLERPFSIGPIDFFHISAFPAADFDIGIEGAPNQLGVAEMIEFMKEHSSDWIARVAVPGHEAQASEEAANLIVDTALGVLTTVLPPGLYVGMGRVTGRVSPIHWCSLRTTDGAPGFGSHERQPGRTVSRGNFGEYVADGADILASAGRRLSGFLDAASNNPTLDDAWCNGAYWFHLATLELVPTVALTQLETAIELVFRAENRTGSTNRLSLALEIFFNLRGEDFMPGTDVTADQFISFVVKGRSEVLHGTWSTLDVDLPDGKGGSILTTEYIAHFTAALLRRVTLAIDAFAATGAIDKKMPDFLAWAKTVQVPLGRS